MKGLGRNSEAAAVCVVRFEMPSKGKCETADGARVGSNMGTAWLERLGMQMNKGLSITIYICNALLQDSLSVYVSFATTSIWRLPS